MPENGLFQKSVVMLSHRIRAIKPSPTLEITTRARELRSEGRDVIGFGAGEPDFDTPEHIKAAAKEAIDRGETKYTAVGGTPEMKKAVVEKLKRENGLEYGTTEVTVCCGGKQVLFNFFLALLNPDDEALIPSPYWVSYPDQVKLAAARPIFLPCHLEQNWLPRAAQLQRAITPRTKMIVFNSPSNPTGTTYSREELIAIGEVLKKHPKLWIVSDDIYEHILYDGQQFYNLLMLFPEFKDRFFLVNGVSKAYSMTGWRIGFGAGPQYMIKAMEKIQGQSTSNACSIAQAAAVAALNGPQNCIEPMVKAFDTRRKLACEMLGKMTAVKLAKPTGAFYLFPRIGDVYKLDRFQELIYNSQEKKEKKNGGLSLFDFLRPSLR